MLTTTIQRYHGSYLVPSLEHATVADAMHPGIVSCETDSTVREVARIMATYHVHCVTIMHPPHDQSDAPYLWGIVSDLDLMRASISPGGEVTAGDLAQQPVISVKPTTMLRDAAELMEKHKTSHVVVIHLETLRPIGVLSTLDVAGVIAWGEA